MQCNVHCSNRCISYMWKCHLKETKSNFNLIHFITRHILFNDTFNTILMVIRHEMFCNKSMGLHKSLIGLDKTLTELGYTLMGFDSTFIGLDKTSIVLEKHQKD